MAQHLLLGHVIEGAPDGGAVFSRRIMAVPKSVILALRSEVKRMLPGFKSR